MKIFKVKNSKQLLEDKKAADLSKREEEQLSLLDDIFIDILEKQPKYINTNIKDAGSK